LTFYKDWKRFDTENFKNKFHNVGWKHFLNLDEKDPGLEIVSTFLQQNE